MVPQPKEKRKKGKKRRQNKKEKPDFNIPWPLFKHLQLPNTVSLKVKLQMYKRRVDPVKVEPESV